MWKLLRVLAVIGLLVVVFRCREQIQIPLEEGLAKVLGVWDEPVHAAANRSGSEVVRRAMTIRDRFVRAQQRLVRVPDYLRRGDLYRVGQVLGSTPGEKTLRVGLGSRDGVQIGSPVLFGDAWIGSVLETGPEDCRVVLVSHADFHAGAYVPQEDRDGKRIRFCVSGVRSNEHALEIRFVTVYDELRAGEPVRTLPPEGERSWSPRLGRIVRLTNPATGSRGVLRLLPHADLSSLLFVSIRCDPAVATGAAVPDLPSSPAPVTVEGRVSQAMDSSPFRRSLLVDRGARDGVEPGAAVLASGVYIGTVARVSERVCRVQVITDPDLQILGTLASIEGEVTTESLAGLRCRYRSPWLLGGGEIQVIDQGETPIAAGGYLLLTAPGSGRVPPGLPVAVVRVEGPRSHGGFPCRLLIDPERVEVVEIQIRGDAAS